MPRPKRLTVLTSEPADRQIAIDEWKEGVEQFLEWANRVRTGETSVPEAVQLDAALTAFSEGRFSVPYEDLAPWAVAAGKNILSHLRDGHWHLRLWPFCSRWLLAKDQRRNLCSRPKCVLEAKRKKRAQQRQSRRELDGGAIAAAKR